MARLSELGGCFPEDVAQASALLSRRESLWGGAHAVLAVRGRVGRARCFAVRFVFAVGVGSDAVSACAIASGREFRLAAISAQGAVC